MMKRIALMLALAATVTVFGGCFAMYDNTKTFLNQPAEGLSEGDMIRTYGAPAYSGTAENQKIYVYKVRDNKFILIVGVYEGYDLAVTCENGQVAEVSRIERPKALTLFGAIPWAETE